MNLLKQIQLLKKVATTEEGDRNYFMTDIELLKAKISESGMTMKAVASKSGILRETLYNRLAGIGEFTASEILGLQKTLHLTNSERNKIFLSGKLN